jgi:hypothetical protein
MRINSRANSFRVSNNNNANNNNVTGVHYIKKVNGIVFFKKIVHFNQVKMVNISATTTGNADSLFNNNSVHDECATEIVPSKVEIRSYSVCLKSELKRDKTSAADRSPCSCKANDSFLDARGGARGCGFGSSRDLLPTTALLKRDSSLKYKSPRRESRSTYTNFTTIISLVTLIFFCCHVPVRIFLVWSYFKHYLAPPIIDPYESSQSPAAVSQELRTINLISDITKLIYYLHCISNPIIYNIVSIKFRKAFLSLITRN